jgi:DNA-binding beta-propeller fold protein YncE
MNGQRSFLYFGTMCLLLTGCPDGGDGVGGGAGFGAVAPPVAYVANQGSNDVSAYTINGATGALVAVTGSPFGAGTTPQSAAVSPMGQFL